MPGKWGLYVIHEPNTCGLEHNGGSCWGLLPLFLSLPSLSAQAKGNPESSFNDGNLRVMVADLFFAGMVTTSTTLSWALLLMILHPDVQGKPGRACEGE